ncbi:hypothetical protein FRC06_003250 [Ceratobasidium sp. 370]|nr:hypothetical protein FRC06_003250 [Ceratobasidium sp. 370]
MVECGEVVDWMDALNKLYSVKDMGGQLDKLDESAKEQKKDGELSCSARRKLMGHPVLNGMVLDIWAHKERYGMVSAVQLKLSSARTALRQAIWDKKGDMPGAWDGFDFKAWALGWRDELGKWVNTVQGGLGWLMLEEELQVKLGHQVFNEVPAARELLRTAQAEGFNEDEEVEEEDQLPEEEPEGVEGGEGEGLRKDKGKGKEKEPELEPEEQEREPAALAVAQGSSTHDTTSWNVHKDAFKIPWGAELLLEMLHNLNPGHVMLSPTFSCRLPNHMFLYDHFGSKDLPSDLKLIKHSVYLAEMAIRGLAHNALLMKDMFVTQVVRTIQTVYELKQPALVDALHMAAQDKLYEEELYHIN